MSTNIRLDSNRSALADYMAPDRNDSADTKAELYLDSQLFVGYDLSSLTQAQRRLAIRRLELYTFAYKRNVYSDDQVYVAAANAAWDEATLTYNNKPYVSGHYQAGYTYSQGGDWAHGAVTDGAWAVQALRNGTVFYSVDSPTIATSRHANAPYAILELGDENPGREIVSASPSSGYTPKNKALSVTWRSGLDAVCLADVTVTATKIRWRETGSETETEIDCGTSESGTIPAASITADSIQWQAETTDSLGNTATSKWFTLSTVEARSEAQAVSPKGIMVDGSADLSFTWKHVISTRTKPTRSEIRVSADGSTWTTVLDQSSDATSGTVAANTLATGTLYWQVRTYNSEGTAGFWSDSATIMVVAAPAAPSVTVEETPRPTVSWQASGQQGYQLRIPGVWESGSVYGVDSSRKLPVILPDGEYIAEVRVVNEYGLWSEWGSAPLTVANNPGDAITLTAYAGGSVALTWSSAGAYERYLVERDGTPIAVTDQTDFTDHKAVGTHSYRILGIQAGSDDYGVSNTTTVTLSVEVNSITDLETGEILPMPYSTTEIRDENITHNRTLKLTHFGGAAYPVPELGIDREKIMTFEAAFTDLAQGARMEALVGRLVALKAKNNEIVVGILGELQKVSSEFWVDYSGEISQIDDREEVAL